MFCPLRSLSGGFLSPPVQLGLFLGLLLAGKSRFSPEVRERVFAAELLLKRLEDPARPTRQVTLKGKLIVRQSCANHE
jgi:hypothetical protein